jgi:hypothetical protein
MTPYMIAILILAVSISIAFATTTPDLPEEHPLPEEAFPEDISFINATSTSQSTEDTATSTGNTIATTTEQATSSDLEMSDVATSTGTRTESASTTVTEASDVDVIDKGFSEVTDEFQAESAHPEVGSPSDVSVDTENVPTNQVTEEVQESESEEVPVQYETAPAFSPEDAREYFVHTCTRGAWRQNGYNSMADCVQDVPE